MSSIVKKYLSVGDYVYSASNGKALQVTSISSDGFSTPEDFFFFSEVRQLYFLTYRGYLDFISCR